MTYMPLYDAGDYNRESLRRGPALRSGAAVEEIRGEHFCGACRTDFCSAILGMPKAFLKLLF